MGLNTQLKRLLFTTTLGAIVSLPIANAGTIENSAPKATAAEAKIKHWRVPNSELRFTDISELKSAYIDTSPSAHDDGIDVGQLGVDAGNDKLIVALAKEIAAGQHGEFDSLLIAHKDKLLFESYFSRGRIDLPHPQSSASKVYVSTVLGRAIQLGHLTMADLDKPLVSFLNELDPSRFTKGAEKITLRKAMMMRSGIRISEEDAQGFEQSSPALKGQGLVQAYLEASAPITAESQAFKYQNDPMLVMQVIEAVVPGSAQAFIKQELLDKLEISNYGWKTHKVTGLPGSASMTSRAMLKFGKLAMNNGKWNGEQLVPVDFITQATDRLIYPDAEIFGGGDAVSNQGYGYYWWGTDLTYNGKSYATTSAQGGGGMYILLIKELDLMVVVTAHDRENTTQQLIAERILPAFVGQANRLASNQ
ncbi:serine hydrolase [Shewanella sp. Scap07]|uniref:serine hydrolase domain-containing protein n=1 Tax=Shewanella sp. Scap07 TaxID=2589987 RepID=UPI0015BC256C|nr:serine hydrolase [Shewanella sp. Scap07]QLE86998.1 serine hydrolase [Shewanella sp. Scap07]